MKESQVNFIIWVLGRTSLPPHKCPSLSPSLDFALSAPSLLLVVNVTFEAAWQSLNGSVATWIEDVFVFLSFQCHFVWLLSLSSLSLPFSPALSFTVCALCIVLIAIFIINWEGQTKRGLWSWWGFSVLRGLGSIFLVRDALGIESWWEDVRCHLDLWSRCFSWEPSRWCHQLDTAGLQAVKILGGNSRDKSYCLKRVTYRQTCKSHYIVLGLPRLQWKFFVHRQEISSMCVTSSLQGRTETIKMAFLQQWHELKMCLEGAPSWGSGFLWAVPQEFVNREPAVVVQAGDRIQPAGFCPGPNVPGGRPFYRDWIPPKCEEGGRDKPRDLSGPWSGEGERKEKWQKKQRARTFWADVKLETRGFSFSAWGGRVSAPCS